MSVNSGLTAIKIVGQRKQFSMQGIPDSSYTRKETIDIDILVTFRSGDRKFVQSIRISRRPHSRKRNRNQLTQF